MAKVILKKDIKWEEATYQGSRLTIQPNGPNKAENHAFKYNHNPRLPPHKVSLHILHKYAFTLDVV